MKVLRQIFALTLAFFIVAAFGEDSPQQPWSQDVIYFALTDRFYDGDPENNIPTGSDPALYDKTQTDINCYHGGDFRGLELALKAGYFKALGITAIWITPPVRNVWCSSFDANGKPKAGYHGYWAQDFLDIDPHLASRRSLDGTREYPDTRDGRMQHYKDFVDLAHGQGIKIIQDIVCNHAGPVFYYDTNGNGHLDIDHEDESVQPFKVVGNYDDADWVNIPKWNAQRTAPAGSVSILGKEIKLSGVFASLESYGRKGMSSGSLGKSTGEEIECDFFSLRDFWTAPGSPHFEQLVDNFVETYAFYAETIGVDGFRIDTIKHVHHAFWDAFTARLRNRLGPDRAKSLILFGEVYDGNPAKMGEYTYRENTSEMGEPCLDALLNFQFCGAARSYLRTKGDSFGSGKQLEETFRTLLPATPAGMLHPFFNPKPGLDGLNSAQKVVNFVENHDGLNRFRVQGISERHNLLANALLLTSPGIPCLYYGTEIALADNKGVIGPDLESGRLTFVRKGSESQFETMQKNPDFVATAALIKLRETLPALTSGNTCTLWVDNDASELDDGVFAYARYGEGLEPLIIVINASKKKSVTGEPGKPVKLITAEGQPLFAAEDKLERVAVPGLDQETASDNVVQIQWNGGVPEAEISVPAQSVNIFRRAPR